MATRRRSSCARAIVRALVFPWGAAIDQPPSDDGSERIAATVGYWSDWLASGSIPAGAYRSLLERSALTLKGLVYAPSGAVMAAATTSLPETPGGGRNWDYRYTWIRDGVCTMAALQDLGFREEARAFLSFLADRLDEAPLQVMYGIGGERELPEVDPRPSQRLRGCPAGPDRQRCGPPAPARHVGLAAAAARA